MGGITKDELVSELTRSGGCITVVETDPVLTSEGFIELEVQGLVRAIDRGPHCAVELSMTNAGREAFGLPPRLGEKLRLWLADHFSAEKGRKGDIAE